MSKKILKIDFEKNEFDFILVGLISGYKDYRLCFELNHKMKVNFQRKDDVILPAGKPGSSTRHSYYSSSGADHENYHIISNRDKSGTGFYIPENKNIDFYLLITDTSSDFRIRDLITILREIDIINGAYELDPEEMKSAEAFLLFLES